MPIFIFKCEDCKRKEEKMMSSKDKPPSCCGKSMERDYNHSISFTINLRG